MRSNFARVLRLSLRYRLTFLGVIGSALAVALLSGANIGAVYPFVKVVLEGESIQTWVGKEIARSHQIVVDEGLRAERLRTALAGRPQSGRQTLLFQLRSAESRMAVESRAEAAYRWAQPYLERYVPADPFQTSCWWPWSCSSERS